MLPKHIRLLSGPGCPVCVTPNRDIDRAIALSRRKDVLLATFGDMMRVPGSTSSLQNEKAEGRDIRIVYSPLHALRVAKENPEKNVVFLAVGLKPHPLPLPRLSCRPMARGSGTYTFLAARKEFPQPSAPFSSRTKSGSKASSFQAMCAPSSGESPFSLSPRNSIGRR
jgi:hydrogenase expression/formation protein HypD